MPGGHIDKRSRKGKKLGYPRWQEFRLLLARARAQLSWREISVRCGQNEGWAQAADKHRGLVNEHTFRKLEELVESLKTEAVEQGVLGQRIQVDAEILRPQRRTVPVGDERTRDRFREMVQEFRDVDFPPIRIAQAFGYVAYSGVHNAIKRDSVPEAWRLEKAQGVLDILKTGDSFGAQKAALKERPLARAEMPTTDAELRRLAEEDAEIARIGPPPGPRRAGRDTVGLPRPQAAAPRPPEPAPGPTQAASSQETAVARPEPKPAPAPRPAEPLRDPDDPAVALPSIRADLEKVLERFERVLLHVPSFGRGPWEQKRDELLAYITSLE